MIKKIVVGPLEENCYLIENDTECLIIDPGAESDKIIKNITKKVVGILITHYHFDHIGALSELKEKYNVKVYDHSNLNEGDNNISTFKFKLINTNGHTMDSVSYLFGNDLFVGDFIFKGSIGRCDLGGDIDIMRKSIEKIKKYDPNIKIHPGHYEDTTLKEEIINNPYFDKDI